MDVLLVLSFEIKNTDKQIQDIHGPIEWHTYIIYINTNYSVLTAATYITLSEQLTDTKIYFTEIHNVHNDFAFQKFLTFGNHTSVD